MFDILTSSLDRSTMDAGRVLGGLVVLLAVFILLIEEGLGIHCYCCNTKYHSDECENLENLSPARRKEYAQDCSLLPRNKNYTKCRKMVQDVNDGSRVIRQCATVGNNECIKRTGTKWIKVIYCECDSDLCNTAANGNDVSIVVCLCLTMVSWFLNKFCDL